MLVLKNINKKYHKKIINNFSYIFQKDNIYCIIGPSGCGKSTLLSIISNNVKSYSGKVFFEGSNIKKLKKDYSALAAKLESMNLKHEYSKIMKVIPYQDIYCGLVFENHSDFFIQQIDYRICELCRIQDGLYDFKIDLTKINDENYNAYPDYVQQARIDLRDGNPNPNISGIWYIPPADKQVCLKLNSQWAFPYPILISLVKDILDLDVYKKLKLQSRR